MNMHGRHEFSNGQGLPDTFALPFRNQFRGPGLVNIIDLDNYVIAIEAAAPGLKVKKSKAQESRR
jgi:hypothetical protein